MNYYYETRDDHGKKHHVVSATRIELFEDADIELEVSDHEIMATALFFGYTPEQFRQQRARVQLGMIRDHRRQIEQKAEVAREPHPGPARFPMCPEFGPPGMEGPTIRSVILCTLVMAAIVAAVIFFLNAKMIQP